MVRKNITASYDTIAGAVVFLASYTSLLMAGPFKSAWWLAPETV